jgi:hypothetical protein
MPKAVPLLLSCIMSDTSAFCTPSVAALYSPYKANNKITAVAVHALPKAKYINEYNRYPNNINFSLPILSDKTPAGIENATDTELNIKYIMGIVTHFLSLHRSPL